MIEENTIQELPIEGEGGQAPEAGPEPQPQPSLSDENRKLLAQALLKMRANNETPQRMSLFTQAFVKKYGQTQAPATSFTPQQIDYRAPVRQQVATEGVSPTQQTINRLDISQDQNAVARRQKYNTYREQAIKDIESNAWKNKIFEGERPALTDYPDMPVEAFQKVNPKAVDEYLSSKDINPQDRYWLRNQILNYGKFRQQRFYVEQGAAEKIAKLSPEDQKNPLAVENAYNQAAQEYQHHETLAVANKLNNVGLDNKPLRGSMPFRDQITGANKALMGVINYAGDLGQQVSGLLELGNIPKLSELGYQLKTTADNLKSRNEIPQTGEAGNLLAGEVLPMALDMVALSKLTGAAGKPLYESLAKARATGAFGKFAEGALGGIAVSPVNSYVLAHQYYNDLIKQGEEPGKAASKADQLLGKNLATDMLMLPLQMGLLKMPTGNWGAKALALGGESLTAGTHFTLQDFNQKSTENPAMHIMDYIHNNEWVSPMITGAALGLLQKGAADGIQNWKVNEETRKIFSYDRQYGGENRSSLPNNTTIANNVLSAIEMKDVPGRTREIKQMVNALEYEGIYTKAEAEKVNNIIDDVEAARKMVPKYGMPHQRVAVFNEALNQLMMERYSTESGTIKGTTKSIDEARKESDERIQRIMDNKEPLYFVNGNETNKTQLMDVLEKNPELLNAKGLRIEIKNDPDTQRQIEELKNKQNAIQEQSPTETDVRPASGNSEEMGGRDEDERPVDQETTGEEAGEEELNKMPGADKVADEIEEGKITDDHLSKVIQESINETQESLQRLREGGSEQAGGDQTDGGIRQGSEEEGNASGISEVGEGAAPGDENQSAEPISSGTEPTDEAPVVQQASMPTAYIPEFWKEDVKPALKNIGENIKDAFERMKRAFDPRAGVSEKALTHIMKALGDRNHMSAIMDAGMASFEKMFDKLSDADRIDFIDRLKTGKPQATPELTQVANLIRKLDDELYNELHKFKNVPWKENHFRVLWKVIPGSKPGAKEKYYTSNRPMEGNRGFLKRATLADMSEGMRRGGVPYSTNPITMFKIAYADGMKFITAQRMWENLKKDKLVKFVRGYGEIPDGFVKLNDRLANVYFRTPAELTLQPPDKSAVFHTGAPLPPGYVEHNGKPYKVEGKPGVGPVRAGEWYIEKGAGRLLNNFLSEDHIRNTKIGRGLMELKNIFTSAELAYSGFHAVAEGMEAINSQIGHGIRKIANLGDWRGGVKDILSSIAAPKTTANTGAKAIKYATSEAFRKSPEGQAWERRIPGAAQYVEDFFQGGGLLKQHDDLRAKTLQLFKDQFNKDNYLGAVLRAVPAANTIITDPLFNVFIPRLKVGMFFKEFPTILKENAERLATGKVTRQELARQTVDFIDDRLGEMNFDNLFWNKTLKTAMQFFLRSVTWKLGSLRATWGIFPEQAKEIAKAAKEGRRPNLAPKAAWGLGLIAMQTAFASVIQHMLAGKGIESGKDIIAPQIDPNDPDQRTVLPTYMKDIFHQYHSITGPDKLSYVKSGMAGQLSKLYDLYNNKDFYGYEIRDQHASALDQLGQSLLYVSPKPFSVSSASEMAKSGQPWSRQVMSALGLQKAPGWLTHTDLQNKIFDLYNERNAGSKPYNDRAANEAKREIKKLFKEGENDAAHDKLEQAIKEGLIRKTQIKSLIHDSRKGGDASVYFFSRLPFEDRKALYEDMDMEERQIYDPKGRLKKQLEQMENAKNQSEE